jgi:complement component 1 Q subcomponent-binding protein
MPQEEEEREDVYGGENMCDFSVYVQSPTDENSGMIFDCVTHDTEVSVNNVQYTTELSKMKSLSRWERGYNYYAGPDFSSLDERLQTGLAEYLQAHGVNEHLAAFVEVMSLDKDQRLYMSWLDDVQGFLKE